jgi:ppGpp synthetase/RelA/SpoT-type nucleotidyltranferase
MGIDDIMKMIASRQYEFNIYASGIKDFFLNHPKLTQGDLPPIHSVRWRIKRADHLQEKLTRKLAEGRTITPDNVFTCITDIAGVRVLHLHQEQLKPINDVIVDRVSTKDWVLGEEPKAYTWDPETACYMKKLGLDVHQKESFYTSVHYVVRPRIDADVSCEIQVRTLFEEIWGEIDHCLNYPNPTPNIACREQLRVLAKLVGAGSRLVDAVFRTRGTEVE